MPIFKIFAHREYFIKIEIFHKIRRIISINFENHFKKFRVQFRKFSRNNSDDFREFRKIFRKISGIISENFANRVIPKNLEIISISFENEFGKFGRIFLEVSKNINEILKNYFENFQKKKNWKISRSIAENFVKYFGKF